MSNQTCQAVGKGLEYIFFGQMLMILAVFPVVGMFLGLGGLLMQLYGLFTLRKFHAGFNRAFQLAVINILVGLILNGVPGVSIGVMIITLLQVRLICETSAEFMTSIGDAVQAEKGMRTAQNYSVCTLVAIVCQVIVMFNMMSNIALPVSLVANISLITGNVLFILYIMRTKNILKCC